MHFAWRIAATTAALGVCAAAWAANPEKTVDSFWAEREAEYRKDSRGPFTAFRADYVNPGDAIVLYAYPDSIGTDPASGAPAIRIALETDLGFLASPMPGTPSGSIGETPFTEGKLVSVEDDLRLGRFLLSVDLQERQGRILAYDPQLLAERFHGFATFPRDEKLQVRANAEPADGQTLTVETSRGLQKSLVRVATFDLKIEGTPCRLTGYREPGSQGALFVPFRDKTSGGETYQVGRYLKVEWKEGNKQAIVDFNHATNPWCAYSPYYNCILPPADNVLPVEIRAGEKTPAGHS